MSEARSGAPWLARADWASGRIESGKVTSVTCGWVLVVLVSAVPAVGLWHWNFFSRTEPTDPDAAVMIPFVIAALCYAFVMVRESRVALRSGHSTLELSTIPGRVGGKLAGVIQGGPVLRDEQTLSLHLRCNVFAWIHGNTSDRGYPSCRWEHELNVQGPLTTGAIAFSFEIPADALPTTEEEKIENGRRSVSWILEVVGKPGKFWRAEYEVPVFRESDRLQ